MASFTDQIMQFNPYVPQLPVEAMTQVGMYKQQKYEEGIQKIQGQIDLIAGLDIIRGVDRKYLQSKLDELGSKLKTVAAGDFSNFQLVNSVSGMTKQIVRDPTVQTAVSATAKYRSESERMQKEIDEGKSSPDNQKHFQKRANNWLSGTAAGEAFGARYIKYFDVNAFARETFKEVAPDGYSFDEIFVTDDNGDPIKEDIIDPKTKKKVGEKFVYSPTMVRLEKEGRFPQKVKDTLEFIFSDGRVAQQLQISGEARYENYDEADLRTATKESMDRKLSIYDAQLVDLNIKKAAGQDVQADIDKLQTARQKTEASYADLLTMAKDNPDGLRGYLHKEDVYDNMTTMYGIMKEKRTVHSNPAWDAMFKVQVEENNNRKHAETVAVSWATLRQRDRHHAEDVRLALLKLQNDSKPKFGQTPPTQGTTPSDISLISIENQTVENAAGKFNGAVTDLIIQSGALSDAIQKTIENYRRVGQTLTPEKAVEKIIEQNAGKSKMTPDQYRQWLYEKGMQTLSNIGDGNMNPKQRAAKQSAENAQSAFTNAMNIRMNIDKQVGTSPILELTKNLRTEEFKTMDGITVMLTPQDQYDIALAYAGTDWYESPEVKAAAKAAQERLTAKGITENLTSQVINQYKIGNTVKTPTISGNVNVLKSIGNLIKSVDSRENVQKLGERAKVIQSFYQINPTLEHNPITGDSETDKKTMSDLATIIGRYQKAKLNESPGFVDNASSMMKIATGEDKGAFIVVGRKDEVTGGVSAVVRFTKSDGSSAGEMTISQKEASDLKSDMTDWWQPDEIRQAQIALDATGNGTTSHSGNVNDPETYIHNDVFYQKPKFTNLRNIPDDVKGNISSQPYIDNNGQVSTLYYGHIFVNGADGKIYKPRTLPPVSSMAEVLQQFKSLTPQMIEKLKIEAKTR